MERSWLLGGAFNAHAETRLWDLRTGTTLQRWYDSGDDGNYNDSHVAFTPDGRHFVRGLRDRIEWYEIGRAEGIAIRLAVLNKRYDQMGRFALSPDGRLLLTADGTGLELWEVSLGKEAMEWSNPDGDELTASAADLSRDGRLLATGTKSGFIRIWDLDTGHLLHSFQADETLRVGFDPNASYVLNGSFTSKDQVASVRFSPDGQRLYSVYSRSGLITMWEFKDGWREVNSVLNHQPVEGLELSPDGALLATIGYDAVRLWDAKRLVRQRLGKITGSYEMHVAFHPTLPLLATTGEGVRVFDLTDPNKPRETQYFPGPRFTTALTYSPDGKYLAKLEYEEPVRIVEADTGNLVRSLGPTEKTRRACDFSPDGRWFAVGGDRMVRIWNVQTGEPVAVLPGHSDWVNHVQFTPDGRRLVTICSQSVRVWDLDRVLHESLDYASHLKDFKIEDQKVVRVVGSMSSTNLQQSVLHPFRASSPHPLLASLNRTGDRAERNRQLFWNFYRARNLASAEAVLKELEPGGQFRTERDAMAGLYGVTARGNARDQRFPLALQQIDAAVSLAPDNVENWNTKAEVLQEAGDYSQALSTVDRAIELFPETSESWATKATIMTKLSNEKGAAQAWAKAIDLAPDQRQQNSYLARSQAGKPMAQTPDAQGWIPLFDGRTLSGWTAPTPSRWEMKDGELTGEGTISHLFSPYTYTNLEFRAEVKVAPGGDGGMFFRTANGRQDGYEAQIANSHPNPQKTGSLQELQPVTVQLVEDDTWFTQHIVAIGNRIIIKVNDEIVTDFVDEKNTHTSGHLALQQAGTTPRIPGTVITFRNVMVKPLSDDAAVAWVEAKKDIPEIK